MKRHPKNRGTRRGSLGSSGDYGVFSPLPHLDEKSATAQRIEVVPGTWVEIGYDHQSKMHTYRGLQNMSRLALLDQIIDSMLANGTVKEVLGGPWSEREQPDTAEYGNNTIAEG
ncbi:MAG: hypothetical protein WB716_08605 [Candidatus Acidiferrales bacterium]